MVLSDERRVGVAHYGVRGGTPVFYFHGHPGSRRDVEFVDPDDVAGDLGCHLIAIERPGYGLSSEQPGRSLGDWSQDVAEVADALGIEQFAVVGYSGGGPYALACAAALSDRVSRVAVVAGVGPADAPGQKNSPGWIYSRVSGRLSSGLMRATAIAAKVTPDRLALSVARIALPTADRKALADARVGEGLVATWREAFRSGHVGAVQDAAIYAVPWGFSLADVSVPVVLWHGTDDVNVPVSVGEFVGSAIPGCRVELVPGEAHISIWVNRGRDILSSVVEE